MKRALSIPTSSGRTRDDSTVSKDVSTRGVGGWGGHTSIKEGMSPSQESEGVLLTGRNQAVRLQEVAQCWENCKVYYEAKLLKTALSSPRCFFFFFFLFFSSLPTLFLSHVFLGMQEE